MNTPASTLPVAQRPLSQVTDVRQMLVNDMAKKQLAAVAASHLKPERMMRLMANAIRTTPKLGQCSPLSLLGAMTGCASTSSACSRWRRESARCASRRWCG